MVPTSQFHQLAAIPLATGLVTLLDLDSEPESAFKRCKMTMSSWTSIQHPTDIFMTYQSDKYEFWNGAGIRVEDRIIDAENNGTDSNPGISLKHYYIRLCPTNEQTRWRASDVGATSYLYNKSTDSEEERIPLIGISNISHEALDHWDQWIGICWYSGRFLTRAEGKDDPYILWSFASPGSNESSIAGETSDSE